MKLSIIIPAFNEQNTICEVLKRLEKVKILCKYEVIIVDDGSTDKTESRIMNHESCDNTWKVAGWSKSGSRDSFQVKESKKLNIKFIKHPINKGKGAAIITGIKHATGDYILIQDADLEYNPAEIPLLLTPIIHNLALRVKGKAEREIAVYGSRFMNKNVAISKLYLLGNKFLTFLTNLLYGTRLTDMETCYKLLPAKIMKKILLQCNGFNIEPEITIALIKNQIQIIEIPISYTSRSHLMGKKITLKDAFGAIWLLTSKKFVI
jgi:glycosyltransferase involved in cell wall biosynthesis